MREHEMNNPVLAETKLDSPGSMLLNVFVEPVRVFNRIRTNSTWLLPFIIALIVLGAFTYLVTPYAMEAQKQQILSSEKMTPEQKDLAIQQMDTYKGIASVIGAGAALIGGAIMVFLTSGILMLMGNVVFGGAAKYMTLVAVVCFAQMPSVIGQIVKTPLILLKQSVDIRTSLAVLLPGGDTSSILYFLLNTLTDVFFVWELVLAIIGVSIVYSFTKQKAAGVVLIPTGVIIGVVTLFKLAF
jgi:hypothetical protein